MSWNEYSTRLSEEWAKLLENEKDERPFQRFMEQHPCLVPGGQSMSGPSGHSAFPAALITQPKLFGNDEMFPDFLWVASDSLNTYVVLIEIESPGKKIFNKDGTPTAKFNQARSQLTDWKAWFGDSSNEKSFRDAYIPHHLQDFKTIKTQYVLIYGRRSEIEDNTHLNKKRGQLMGTDEFLMSFDRICPLRDQDQYMTARKVKNGYRAVAIPPTLQLGPQLADYRQAISEKESVAATIPYLSESRKSFLAQRMPYWDEWSKNGSKGIIYGGDFE